MDELYPARAPLDSAEHRGFRATVRRFVETEIAPHHAQWEADGQVPKALWRRAGELGLLCLTLPEAYGGAGVDFGYSAIVVEEMARAGASGPLFYLHSDIVAPYLLHYGTEAQKRQWLPRMASGELISAIGMTEPGAGSDLAAIRTRAERIDGAGGARWRINGQKIFISNGQIADLLLLAARTEGQPGAHGVSLLLVEATRPGFERGRRLDKLGMHAQDTSELFFTDVEVPLEHLLGEPGRGFAMMMNELPQERLLVAITAVAAMEAAVQWTRDHVQQRQAFGAALAQMQTVRHRLAELHTQTTVARSFLNDCITRHLRGELDTATASMAKWWAKSVRGNPMRPRKPPEQPQSRRKPELGWGPSEDLQRRVRLFRGLTRRAGVPKGPARRCTACPHASAGGAMRLAQGPWPPRRGRMGLPLTL